MLIRTMLLSSLAALAGLCLAGCETMSAEECAVADWSALGYEDASNNGVSRFSRRAEACAERGFAADESLYREGMMQGMRVFCQPQRGFELGRSGREYVGGCPEDLQPAFAGGYSDGQRVFDMLSELSRARTAVANEEARRAAIDNDVLDAEQRLRDAATDEERRNIRSEIDSLRRQRRDTNEDLRIAQEYQLGVERLITELRQELGYRYGPW
jgi:hypothetical protein